MRLLLGLMVAVVLADAGSALETSMRPLARKDVGAFEKVVVRPRLRPADLLPVPARANSAIVRRALTSDDIAANTADVVLSISTMGKTRSPRPFGRPGRIEQKAMARQREREHGMICNDPDLLGEYVGRVPGRIPGCGAKEAVRLRSVSGVTLNQQAVLTCGTARAVKVWVNRGLRPAVGSMGGGVAGLKVAAHYACRTRNNRRGARISEHGKAKAIDISEIRLVNGDTLNVLRDWGSSAKGRVLRASHRAACGIFGTVLGPGSDGYHRDHIHFDTARHGNGSYCRPR